MRDLTQVKIDKENLVQLVDFKLDRLRKEIEKILEKWNYLSSNKFLDEARNGTLSEAEEDAIILKNLKDEIDRLEQQKTDWLKQE
jgi:hypothetical protein